MSSSVTGPANVQPSRSLADRIADYSVGLTFEDLPGAVVHEAKRRLIDAFACAVGAMDADAVSVARIVARREQVLDQAGILGGGRSSTGLAAFTNGLMVRYLDYNDTYLSLEPAHPSDNIPAAVAVAEEVGAGGRDVLTAIILGYEIQCRLCDAASLRAHGIDHVTYGAISTAALAAKLYGLDHARTAHALGIAGVCNVALRQTRSGEISMWKGCAFANAARNGTFAAQLAAAGMTGPAPIFEGDLGFCKLVSGPIDLPRWGGRDGEGFMILRTSIKYWPAEYHSQSAIEAALALRPRIPSIDAIRSVQIHTFDAAVDIIGKDPEKWRPRTRETADHSLPYITAIALADGDVGRAQFSEERLADPRLLNLVGRVSVHRDAGLSARYPNGIPNRLTILLNDGRTLMDEVEFPRGHAHNPMTDEEVEAKFRRMADGVLTSDQQDRVLRTVWSFEHQSEVSSLIATFSNESVADRPGRAGILA